MSAEPSESGAHAKSDPVMFDPDAACEACGRFGAFRFDGRALCDECYTNSGSCCPEFGKDDLWSAHERSDSKR